MSGHSKWANIQHRKGRQDAKRGKVFTKAAKEIIIAAKNGGDPAGNPRLRAAIAAAKAVNLPKDKIEAAIRKGTGEDAGGDLTECFYEGYGPAGIAIMVEVATDNKNRTVAEVRHLFTKHGGSLGTDGSVSWMFDRKGVITVDKAAYTEDQMMEVAMEAGADDVIDDEDVWTLQTAMADFAAVRDALESAGVTMQSAELAMVPQNLVAVDAEAAQKVIRFMEALDDNDDVQNVYANFDLPECRAFFLYGELWQTLLLWSWGSTPAPSVRAGASSRNSPACCAWWIAASSAPPPAVKRNSPSGWPSSTGSWRTWWAVTGRRRPPSSRSSRPRTRPAPSSWAKPAVWPWPPAPPTGCR